MINLNNEAEVQVINDKITRKILSHTEELMLVEMTFQKGGVGEPHSHEAHEQVGYIVEGKFEVTVDGVTKILGKGDSYYAAKNVVHGVVCLEDAILIDAFTPMRKDFL